MNKTTKFFFILAISCLVLGLGLDIKAQENEEETPNLISTGENEVEATQEIALDENISPEDLEIKEPKLLPDSPFYFLKEWTRKIQSAFTFDKIKKAQLENKYANEKLIELKKLVEKNADPEKIGKATENYQNQIEKIKELAEKIKEKAVDSENVDKFLDKFTKQQILQEKILQKLEEQVPTEAFEKIKEAREQHLVKFGEVMTKLEDRVDKIKEKIENAFEQEQGSQFKDFKNLEILKNIEEKLPEKAKEAVQQVQATTLEKLRDNLKEMSPEEQEKLKNYIDNVSGDKEKQLQILESLKTQVSEMPVIQEKLNQIRERVVEKVIEKVQETTATKNCPEIEKPSPDFCPNARIVPQKDEQGCIVGFKCFTPEEIIPLPLPTPTPGSTSGQTSPGQTSSGTQTELCITLWDPVCGKDGKTYSNKCFAKVANVEVAYQGECKAKECEKDIDCPQPKCGSITETSVTKCIGMVARCIDGRCVVKNETSTNRGGAENLEIKTK